MKKILSAIIGVSALALVSCSNKSEPPVAPEAYTQTQANGFVETIVTPVVINEILNDPKTPTFGPKDAKQAVVVFFDFGCGTCAQISKQVAKLTKEHPNAKFIFKAYPSPKRDAKVPNYASLIASEAYLQGGSELFMAYDKAIFDQRIANGKLTESDVDGVAKQLGIDFDKKELLEKAKTEELQTRKLGKTIGFKGPHDIIIMPTKLAGMSQAELNQNADSIKKDIFVISHRDAEKKGLDSVGIAKWEGQEITRTLNKVGK
ncbi:thioredoxin domain-containing protein [Francisella adeliensis]|uniref:Thioredoxin domain-containing protein n=1 Tax=Francisella adeliensis TaxID=2007306 RepID=A0A2Z4XYK1_9GAMM|nr:thioredoxin domain-containing protein [Francisella adeliensis]AXA33513.1 hypothetical protein CDH04_03375 [Francisella adeliensis]MBK2084789.1 thioredoxin domain-containing protein [Francisella adeliensis]MBK2097268.1 thioredoxin domain-containing protein [Francisella adeliensis]QIW11744.1 thioredoxin domain-containing protein [Francisella adeliensis]QIW13618.1 thioredoxin domain-containing protein [Francisella adeliensis]